MRLAPFVTAAGFVLLSATSAFATSNFPSTIRAKLTLSYDPACATCHSNGITGRGTVTTPFGKSMLARGLVASDESALDGALDKMITDKVDSDLDGVTDIDELKAGTDPNAKPGVRNGVFFGCSTNAHSSDESDRTAGLVFVAAGAALLVARRRLRSAR
ncbi:hypothetical protein BH09MYX1_BH09MYX1_10230 [soil metagenome]